MKKTILYAALFAALAATTLYSCAGDDNIQNNLKEPTTASENKNAPKMSAVEAKSATEKNLVAAFTGETTASAKYTAYAKKANEEGFPQIALLFKTAAASEKIHADNHKAVLDEMGAVLPEVKPKFNVGTTQENLKDAISGESYEISTMYPEFMATADAADNQLALISMKYAYRTEQKHKVMYEKALSALGANTTASLANLYYICPTCGNTYEMTAPKRCGISMTNGERFIKITGA